MIRKKKTVFPDLPIPAGDGLRKEIEDWRWIGWRWRQRHADWLHPVSTQHTACDDLARQGHSVNPRKLRGYTLHEKLGILVRATNSLLNDPPPEDGDELNAWRKLGKLAIPMIERMDFDCSAYSEATNVARRLLGVPMVWCLHVIIEGVESSPEINPDDLHPNDYEVIVRKKRGGMTLFQKLAASIYVN